ncbi:MAG: hypothetical protein QM599_01820 [Pseudoxanthomonas sp.]
MTVSTLEQRARETLDEAISVDDVRATDSEGKPRKQSDILLDIGKCHDLFHAPDGTAYARDGLAVHAIESGDYRNVLAERFYAITGKGANRNSIADAITTLCSIAKFRGDKRDVWLRTARSDAGLVLDMGRADHRVIEVGADGWRWSNTPLMFRRTAGMGELPGPKEPDFARLWDHINITKEHRPLVAGWLLAAWRPGAPCPIVFLSGEQGTGKSTAARMLRSLVDPSAIPLRAPPKELRDLLVGARNGWVLTLDNLSAINPQLSDALCRVATGGAISERTLYTNTDETLVEVQRPVICNGIEDLASRPDLAERGLHVELEVIQHRRTESELWRGFNADAPHIFAAILSGLVAAIRDHESINIGNPPRMADFAKWAAAGVGELGFTAKDFIEAYRVNLDAGMGGGIEGSPIGVVLLGFIRNRRAWEGTAAALLAALASAADDAVTRSQAWPRSPRGLSGTLRRLAPALRLQGVEIEQDRSATARTIRLSCKARNQPSQPSQPSFSGAGNDANDRHDGQNPALHDDCPACGGEGCDWCGGEQ